MNKFIKGIVGKCFLYTLLGVFVFALLNLIGMYLFKSTDFLNWDWSIRSLLVLISFFIPLLISCADND